MEARPIIDPMRQLKVIFLFQTMRNLLDTSYWQSSQHRNTHYIQSIKVMASIWKQMQNRIDLCQCYELYLTPNLHDSSATFGLMNTTTKEVKSQHLDLERYLKRKKEMNKRKK